MSMPEFPEVDPNLTRDQALNMILSSIAMEEVALSHIINAEGEKLQHVLRIHETSCGKKPTVDEVLAVNHSVTSLLDSVSHNQMILKSKMDKVISALPKPCPEPICPPKLGPDCQIGPADPTCRCSSRCSAVFKAVDKYQLWCAGSALQWNTTHISGGCVCLDRCDKTKVNLRSWGRIKVDFAVNVKAKESCKCEAAISLQMINNHQCMDIYTVRNCVTDDSMLTISMSGIIVETEYHARSSLLLKLVSSDSLIVEDSMLSIMKI